MNYPYCKKDFALAKRYVDAVMTMNGLYEKTLVPTEDPIAGELFTPPPVAKIEYDDVGEWPLVKKLLYSLIEDYHGIGNEIRKTYMTEQILSVVHLGEWVFEKKDVPYVQMVGELLRTDPTPVTDREIAADKKRLQNLLSDKNYKGTVEEQFAAWRADHIIAPERLEETVRGLIAETKGRTIDLGLKEIEQVDAEGVIKHGVNYQGFCDFDNHKIYINGDLSFTYQDLKFLICHETYPGHMAHMQVRKTLVEEGRIPADAALVVVDTASSPIFEGLADNGVNFIGFVETIDDKINEVYQNLKERAGLTASYLYHGEHRSEEEVAAYLKEAAFADDAWVGARIRLMNYPLRKPFLSAYWRGNDAVKRVYDQVSKEQMPQFVKYLYQNMHSVHSLRKFL